MYSLERKITKDIYERAIKNRNYIQGEDMNKVFNEAELCGYGIYGTQVFEKDNEYYVSYYMGSTCD